jgi:hypothetical protein
MPASRIEFQTPMKSRIILQNLYGDHAFQQCCLQMLLKNLRNYSAELISSTLYAISFIDNSILVVERKQKGLVATLQPELLKKASDSNHAVFQGCRSISLQLPQRYVAGVPCVC